MSKKSQKQPNISSIPVKVTKAKKIAEDREQKQEETVVPINEERKRDDPMPSLEELLSPDGKKRDMTKLEKANPRRRLIIRIIIILAAILAISLAGFFYYAKTSKKFGQNIGFMIQGPATVSSGEVVTLRVQYDNRESIDLLDAELTMQFPDGFSFQSSIPSPSTPNTWLLSKLDAGSGGVVEIRGKIIGDVGTTKSFTATLNYTPSNFNYPFKQEASFETTITSSALSLEIDAPQKMPSGKEFSFTMTYANSSQDDLDGVQIVMQSPAGYQLTTADPEGENSVWKIGKLETGKEGTITVTGTLTGEVGQQKQFSATIGIEDSQGIFSPQTEKTFLVLMIKAGVTMEVEATTDTDGVAEWGEDIIYKVTYTNDGDVAIQDASIKLALTDETSGGTSADLIDWNNITTVDDGVVQDGNIVWKPESITALKELKPTDSGTFTVTIPLIDQPEITSDSEEQFHIVAVGKMIPGSVTDENSTDVSVSEPVETKIATDMNLSTEARYYSDTLETIGAGPIPPVVGQETRYVIKWYLTNSSNDIDTVEVKTTLPAGVTWIGDEKISAGEPLQYNPQTKSIVWKINRVPAGTGDLIPRLEAQFTISITPTSSEEGTFVVLTNATEATAKDAYLDIRRTDKEVLLTTDLQNDPEARGKGIVQPSQSNANTNTQ